MHEVILVFQIIVAVMLSGAILLQVKGTGFGRVWGGLSTSSTRRGLESVIFKLTFVFSFVFIILSLLSLLV